MERRRRLGEEVYSREEKHSSDILTLTYGALVTQILEDTGDTATANKQLRKCGQNIGSRIIDEFIAKSGLGPCVDFRETCETVAHVGLRMYLGANACCEDWSDDGRSCTLVLETSPLADHVELPPALRESLWYSELLAGAIEGALEPLQLEVTCEFISDALRGDAKTSMRLTLVNVLRDDYVKED